MEGLGQNGEGPDRCQRTPPLADAVRGTTLLWGACTASAEPCWRWRSHTSCECSVLEFKSVHHCHRLVCSGCEAFGESCSKAQEPEDVTVGLIIGEAIYTSSVGNRQYQE